MDVIITKGDGAAHDRTLLVEKGDARVVPVHVVHDLPHLAVESIFGIDDGLWGELASGKHADAGRAAASRDPKAQKKGRIVSGAATGEGLGKWLTEGHRVAKVITNAVANRWGDGPDTPEGVRQRLAAEQSLSCRELLDRLDDTTIDAAIRCVARLDAMWRATPPGETLKLTWPL